MLTLAMAVILCLVVLAIGLVLAYYSLSVIFIDLFAGGWISSGRTGLAVIVLISSIAVPVVLFPTAAWYFLPNLVAIGLSPTLTTILFWLFSLVPIAAFGTPLGYILYRQRNPK